MQICCTNSDASASSPAATAVSSSALVAVAAPGTASEGPASAAAANLSGTGAARVAVFEELLAFLADCCQQRLRIPLPLFHRATGAITNNKEAPSHSAQAGSVRTFLPRPPSHLLLCLALFFSARPLHLHSPVPLQGTPTYSQCLSESLNPRSPLFLFFLSPLFIWPLSLPLAHEDIARMSVTALEQLLIATGPLLAPPMWAFATQSLVALFARTTPAALLEYAIPPAVAAAAASAGGALPSAASTPANGVAAGATAGTAPSPADSGPSPTGFPAASLTTALNTQATAATASPAVTATSPSAASTPTTTESAATSTTTVATTVSITAGENPTAVTTAKADETEKGTPAPAPTPEEEVKEPEVLKEAEARKEAETRKEAEACKNGRKRGTKKGFDLVSTFRVLHLLLVQAVSTVCYRTPLLA